ncbi:MAG: aspartate kinase, partial [Myxococcales bacterium]
AQAVEFARDKGIVIHARSTFEAGAGTRIVPGRPRELRISGVTQEKEILVVAADDCTDVSGILERNGAWPRELWCEGSATGLAIISLENVHGLPALLRDLRASPGTRIEEGLAQVSVVGSGVGASREPLERARRALGVPPRSILVSPLRISALVPREESDACVRRLHAEFVEGTSR